MALSVDLLEQFFRFFRWHEAAKYINDNTASPQTPASSVTGPDSFGASSVVGTSLNYARQDHDHGLPAAPVTTSNTVTLTNKRITRRIGSTASSATPTINTDNFDVYELTAMATAVTSMTTNLSGTPVDGDLFIFCFTDNGTPRAITWGASFESSTVALPTTTTTSTLLTVGCRWNTATSKWRCVAVA